MGFPSGEAQFFGLIGDSMLSGLRRLDLFRDDTATEADVAGIEDGGLAGGGALDRLSEAKSGVIWSG